MNTGIYVVSYWPANLVLMIQAPTLASDGFVHG